MTFAEPFRLGLLAVVIALAATYVIAQRRRPRYALRFTNLELLDVVAPSRPGFRRHVAACTVLASAASMVLALARPARTVQVARRSGAVVIAIDVSPSMMATDVSPSRLAAARTAVDRFSELVPGQIRLGLVTFAGTAQVLVAPTSDHELIRRALAHLAFRSQTSLGEAIHASLDALPATGAAGASGVVVLSDGASTTGRSETEAAARARVLGVSVSTIAFGTRSGTVVLGGEAVPVPPDPVVLQRISSTTGGRFYSAASGDELTAVYRSIWASVVSSEERRDLTTWFVGGAFTLVVVACALSLVWFSRLP